MSRSLLILGAGRWQMPLIAKAAALNYHVIVCDGNANAPGFNLADISLVCDIRDPSDVLAKIKGLKISGVLSDQTDIPLLSISAVAQELGLPNIPKRVIERATNKYLMRQAWENAGVTNPLFGLATTEADMSKFAKDVGYPLISKPVAAAGSLGVRVSHSPTDLLAAFEFATQNSKSKQVIIEKFIEGREYTVEAFSTEGEVEILAISQKTKPNSQYQVSTLLEYPPDLPSEVLEKISETVIQAVKALGIASGPSHSEVILSPSGPVMVETAARSGGFRISSDIIRLSCGFDQLDALIKLSLGEKTVVEKKWKRAVTLGFFHPKPGKITSINGLEELHKVGSLYSFGFLAKIGDSVGELQSDRSRAGYFILSDPSTERVRRDTAAVYDTVKIITE